MRVTKAFVKKLFAKHGVTPMRGLTLMVNDDGSPLYACPVGVLALECGAMPENEGDVHLGAAYKAIQRDVNTFQYTPFLDGIIVGWEEIPETAQSAAEYVSIQSYPSKADRRFCARQYTRGMALGLALRQELRPGTLEG